MPVGTVPATVVTVLSPGVAEFTTTLRMTWLVESATQSTSLASTERAAGLEKRAVDQGPSWKPLAMAGETTLVPAMVITVPVVAGVMAPLAGGATQGIMRIRLTVVE